MYFPDNSLPSCYIRYHIKGLQTFHCRDFTFAFFCFCFCFLFFWCLKVAIREKETKKLKEETHEKCRPVASLSVNICVSVVLAMINLDVTDRRDPLRLPSC